MVSHVDTYPVGLLMDYKRGRLRAGVRRVWEWAREGSWRAVRNSFNGYLSECYGHHHNAGRGWTKRGAERRLAAFCAAAPSEDTDRG